MRSRLTAIGGGRLVRRVVAPVAVCGLVILLVATAWGFWSTGDAHGTAAAEATTLGQGPTPTAVSYGTRVVVAWGIATAASGQAADGYIVRRYDAGSGALQATLGNCARVVRAITCAELAMPAGTWQYTVTPVMGEHWRGTESPHGGVVQTSASTLELTKSVFGPPFPAQTSATLTGFQPNEGLSYSVDGSPVAGFPSNAAGDGSAAISAISIPALLGDGPHTVGVVGDDPESPSHAAASILVDTTPPAIKGFLTPAPNAAGWNNTSPVEVNGTVDDGAGSGIAKVRFTDDGTDPKTSSTARDALAPPIANATSTYKYYGIDVAGNESDVDTLVVKIDTIPPGLSPVDLVDVNGGAWIDFANRRTYYRGADAGSYSYRFDVIDPGPGASGPASAADSALGGNDVGFASNSQRISTPAGGPYVLNPISWVAGTTHTVVGTITLSDVAGNDAVTTGDIVNDSASPSGGSVDATGLGGSDGRYSTSQTINLSLVKGTDSGSGLADGSAAADIGSRLMRAAAPLTSGGGVDQGTCGTYGNYAQVGTEHPPVSTTDTVPADAECYRYRYLVADHVGNIAAYTSPDILVQTATAASLTPTVATLTAVSGAAAQSIAGSTVYYNPARSGSFNVESSASAPYSGIAHMTFPAIAGFTGDGDVSSPLTGSTFRATYAWTSNEASPSPGVQSLSATNNAGLTSTNSTAFTVVKDGVSPSGGSVDATGLGGTGGRYSTSTTLSVAFAPGADSGSGLAASGAQLLRASASLSSDGTANGACGTFGAYTQVGANDRATPASDTVPVDATCYRYRYVVADRVGNLATYTSPDVKVQAAPPVAGLSFTALTSASWSGSGRTVYYRRAAAAGGFTVIAAADLFSGMAVYTFPTLPAGWTGTSGGTAIRKYAWSAANPTTPTGAAPVSATNNAGESWATDFTVTADSTMPTGGSVTYSNGTIATTTTSVSFSQGSDTGSGLDPASGILRRRSATLTGTTCGTFGAFTTVATDPSSPASSAVSGGSCYQYEYLASDNVGNQATFTSTNTLKVNWPALTHALSLAIPAGAYLAGSTLYYNSNGAGSFKIVDALAGGSGPASVTYPAMGLSGWTHSAETVSTPAGGPYSSSLFSWSAHPSSPSSYVISGKDTLGATSTTTATFVSDQSPPSGGSISYPNATVTTTSVALTLVKGTDNLAGVNAASGIVRRDDATLNTTTGSCGTFPGTFTKTATLVGGADTSVTSGHCYQYRYLVSDNVGNQVTYTSGSVVKVDTTAKFTAMIALLTSGRTRGPLHA